MGSSHQGLDPKAIGEEARQLRTTARVSLEDLARKLHRDPSSLSRFERGLSLPRDLDAVMAAYRDLRPRRVRVQEPVARIGLLLWLLARLAALATVELVTHRAPLNAEELRVFITVSAVGYVVVMIRESLFHLEGPVWQRLFRAVRNGVPVLLVCAAILHRWEVGQPNYLLVLAVLIQSEMGYFVFGHQYYRAQPRGAG